MHWADFTAQRLQKERGGNQILCSGITPSGEIHLGNLREILTAEMIHRACLDLELNSRYIFIVDSMDPLRRIYPFLSDEYQKYIGCPLAYIPAPDKDGRPDSSLGSYSDYFLSPFLDALQQIGVQPEIIMNHQSYENGEFAEKIDGAIKHMTEIREIIETISGRELSDNWFPYNPIGSDGSMDGVIVTGYEYPYVSWTDQHDISGRSDIRKGEGKLPWRIDWAARWGFHGITCEPAGKDHGSAGGSFDTGIPICRLLGSEPPGKMVYEWIQLKGMGPMSSSSGNTIGPIEALGLVPPEIIRYLIAGSKVNKHIDFDTGGALFTMADEYERLVANPPSGDAEKLSKRQLIAHDTKLGALRMSQITHGTDPADSVAGVSFRHLSMLAQIKSDDEGIWNSLRQSSHIDGVPNQNLINRLARMRNWIEGPHFPIDARIIIQSAITEEARDNLSTEQNSFLSEFQKRIIDYEWNESSINECIRESAAAVEIGMRQAYMALYWTILGKYFGPRIAALMSEIDKDEIMAIFSN